MRATQVDITQISIDESTSQQDTTVTGALAEFRGVTVNAVDSNPDDSPSIQKNV